MENDLMAVETCEEHHMDCGRIYISDSYGTHMDCGLLWTVEESIFRLERLLLVN